jgi:hypothetical protein
MNMAAEFAVQELFLFCKELRIRKTQIDEQVRSRERIMPEDCNKFA